MINKFLALCAMFIFLFLAPSFSMATIWKPSSTLDRELLTAVTYNQLEKVEQLIKDGANVNAIISKGTYQSGVSNSTPLGEATYYGRTKIVKLLIRNNANINLKHLGETPLHWSAIGGKDVAYLLLEAGADVNSIKRGQTPLEFAQTYSLPDIKEVANLIEDWTKAQTVIKDMDNKWKLVENRKQNNNNSDLGKRKFDQYDHHVPNNSNKKKCDQQVP